MKKFVRTGLLAALMATGATAAHAQISFGPKVGLNLASTSYELSSNEKAADGKVPDKKMIVGASFGLMLNARFGNLAVQPALTYAMKGVKLEATTSNGLGGTSTFTVTERLSYIDIPINLVYTTGGDHGLQVFAGPYVGFGIGGKVKAEGGGDSEEYDVKFTGEVKKDDTSADVHVGNPDFGINFGIGYLINNFQVQAGYGLGLSNLDPKVEGGDAADRGKQSNRVIAVTAAYLFGGN